MDNSKLRKILLSPWFALILIALAAFVIYSNTYNCPFVFDDIHNIKENSFVQLTSFDLQGLRDAGFRGPSSNRAVANISFALNYYFGGYDVTGYHLINIIIHIICGILVYFLAFFTFQRDREITTDNSSLYLMSLFAALLFTVHPLQTQSVTYIVQRMNSMAAMFYLLSMLLYIRGRLTEVPWRRWTLFSACLVSWVLALGSKEIAATLPPIIFLYEWYFFQDMNAGWLKRNVVYFLGVCIVAGVAALIYLGGSPLDRILAGYATRDFTMYERVLTEFRVVIFYMTLLILPLPSRLNLLHDIPVSHSLLDPVTTLLSLFVIAGLIGYAVYRARKWRLVSFCILWFFVNLVIESSIIGLEIVFEHRLYLPMFSVALLAAWLPFRFLPKRRVLAVLICVSIVISLGTATYLRNRVWRDRVTLWSDALAKSPRSPRACTNLGNALASEGRYDEAMRYHSRVLESNPDHADANYNMGLALQKRGDTDGAIRYYMKTLSIDPGYGKAHYNLGKVLEDSGDLEGAARHYSEALLINPEDMTTHSNLGVVMSRLGDLDGALEHLREAVRIDSENATVRNNLGGVLEMRGDLEGAARHYSKALVIKPGYAKAYANLSRVLGSVGDPAVTVRCYREVLRSDPENADVHMNLGIALSRLGDLKGAVDHFSEAVRINPEDARTHYNLGLAFSRQGRMDKAAEQYLESLRIRPQNPKAHYNLALALRSLGDFQGATNHFEEAARLDPHLKTQVSRNIEEIK